MAFEERLDEYKARYRNASLPEDLRQNYSQIMAFMDAGDSATERTQFAGELASLLECNLDVLFPVAETEEEIQPEELIGEQRYEDLQDALRNYQRLEGDVEEAILEHLPGEGDDVLCLFPAPFQLTPDEAPDPGLLGDVIGNLLDQFLHPTLLLRKPPHHPSEDLYDNVVVAGSSLHNLMRLLRCTAGICPEGTELKVAAVADERFLTSMRELIKASDEYDYTEDELKLEKTLHETMRRQLRQARTILQEEHDMPLTFEIHEGQVETLKEESPFLESAPTLLSLPMHFSGGGYDPAALKPLFKEYTSTEILTI